MKSVVQSRRSDAACLLSVNSLAQTPARTDRAAEEVVVTAARVEQPVERRDRPVTVITRDHRSSSGWCNRCRICCAARPASASPTTAASANFPACSARYRCGAGPGAGRWRARRLGDGRHERRSNSCLSIRSSASRSCAGRARACTAPMRSAASSRSSRVARKARRSVIGGGSHETYDATASFGMSIRRTALVQCRRQPHTERRLQLLRVACPFRPAAAASPKSRSAMVTTTHPGTVRAGLSLGRDAPRSKRARCTLPAIPNTTAASATRRISSSACWLCAARSARVELERVADGR